MVFAPKLEGGVAYNQPIDTPNAMSAVAGLLNFGVQSLGSAKPTETKLTEDEKFAVAVREFEEAKGGAFTWDRKGMREFIFQYPQFTSQAKGFGDNLGIMTTAPQEVARDAVAEWAKTPEGAVSAAYASNLPPEEADAKMAQDFTNQMVEEANIAKLNREVAKHTAEGTLTERQWGTIKATQKTFVDDAIQIGIGPIVNSVLQGVPAEVPPELAEAMGVRYTEVTLTNLSAFLADAKIYLTNNSREKFEKTFGRDELPSEAWSKEVYASLDALVEVGKSFDTPQEQAEAMSALIEIQATQKLDEAGLTTTLFLMKTLPPATMDLMFSQTPDIIEKLKPLLGAGTPGEVFGKKEIQTKIDGGSVESAEDIAKASVAVLSETMDARFFYSFKYAAKRSNFNVVDGATWKQILGNNVEQIKNLNSKDPEFRAEVSDWMTSDIQQTISIINSNLIAGVSLQFDGKNYVLVPEKGTLAEQKWNDPYRPYSQSALNQLPDGLTLETLNEKISSLGLLGDVGKEVQDAIGILNTKPKEDMFNKIKNIEPTSGTVTKSSKGGARDVGAELGIDFATYEAENELPSGFLNKMAIIESGGNPAADNPTSTAGGLFQQIDSNAAAYGVTNRYDPVQSTEGAVKFAVENKRYLTGALGREPTGGELYLAHQQGPGGAAKLLSNPDALAVDIVGKKAVELNGGNANMTAGEFANIWISKYNGSRGQTSVASNGSKSPSVRSDSASLDSGVMTTGGVPLNMPVEAVGGATEGLSAQEVAQLVERVKQAPEKAIQVVQEAMGGKPVDPMIMALIEALVGVKK